MKLGLLFSGGKDSCLALHRAVAAGHEVACLLTLLPERDDSWMFHTPALEWTALQAEALGIAQLTAATPGEPE
ncbi:MAG TPA: ATP-binding protein, partial [Candidatus Poseidoniales archaeon]|nr:ATP-binding protein [Candidatus Poseidoniales archaeon]